MYTSFVYHNEGINTFIIGTGGTAIAQRQGRITFRTSADRETGKFILLHVYAHAIKWLQDWLIVAANSNLNIKLCQVCVCVCAFY